LPKVSVIIPTYNRSMLVKEAIQSVLKQSLKDFELIVIDDGSTDNTSSVVKSINDTRIKYFYKENGGVSSARNLGLVKRKGEYVAFLDDDDLMPKNYLEVMICHLNENRDYKIAYSLFTDVYPDGKKNNRFGEEHFISGCLTKNFFKKIPHISSAAVFHHSILDGFFFDEHLKTAEDSDFYLRISTRGTILCVPEVSIIRRVTPGSLSREGTFDSSISWVRILERFYFQLDGHKFISARTAKTRIGQLYRRMAREHYRQGNKKAAILLFKKAVSYKPANLHYHRGLIKAWFLSKRKDKLPEWQMPKPLPYPKSTVNTLSEKVSS